MIGYPRFLAASPSALCRLVGLDPAEARWLTAETEATDATLRRLVEEIADPRLRYVSTLDVFAGSEACGPTGLYVSPLVPQHVAYSFHPTAAGHALLAERLWSAQPTGAATSSGSSETSESTERRSAAWTELGVSTPR